jgi:hypothetical protein
MKNAGSKLDAKGEQARWIGYSGNSNGHRIYWPNTRQITIERNVMFEGELLPTAIIEEILPIVGENLRKQPEANKKNEPTDAKALENVDRDVDVSVPKESNHNRVPDEVIRNLEAPQVQPRRSERLNPTSIPVDNTLRRSERIQQQTTANISETLEDFTGMDFAMAATLYSVKDPANVEQARQQNDWPEWDESIQRELKHHEELGTWDVVDPPPGANIIRSRLILRYKLDKDGQIQTRKARLVAQGFSQKEGIDYHDTFSPTAKLTAIRIVVALAVRNDWEIEQTDVDAAYLNAKLKENIYMRQPKDFEITERKGAVLHLKKAIYGLKQSGREWYETLSESLKSIGFSRCQVEHGVFHRYDCDATVLAVDVDDITIAANSREAVRRFKQELRAHYKIKDMGDLNWLLGLEVTRNRQERTISFGQSAYVQRIVERFNLEDAYPLSIPINPNDKISINDCPKNPAELEKMRHVPYKEAIGSLMYAVVGSRPDIAYSVSLLARFMQNPGRTHWEAVKRVIRYLKGTKDAKLTIGRGGTFAWALEDKRERRGLEGFSDADGNSQEHRHAISGYAFTIDGGAVSWNSKKQSLVSLSTTESEYVAVTHASKEAIWIRMFISDVFRPLTSPVLLYCDNMSAIDVAKNDRYHARTKHIDIRYHFIRDIINKRLIDLRYCPTEDMAADIFTKALPKPTFERLRTYLGVELN